MCPIKIIYLVFIKVSWLIKPLAQAWHKQIDLTENLWRFLSSATPNVTLAKTTCLLIQTLHLLGQM